MFKILHKTLTTGTVTLPYPANEGTISAQFRGRPDFDFPRWADARPAADACPTGAISIRDREASREVTVDYGRCIFCGECAEASTDGAVRVTSEFELATGTRGDLVFIAQYGLTADGAHERFVSAGHPEPSVERAGWTLDETIRKVLGRSLAIREVDAGSCNGCELEIIALNNPVHDIERFGIHFVASPRHADMLLVTGPVTSNMEPPRRQPAPATSPPSLAVAVGASGPGRRSLAKQHAPPGG